MVPITTPRLLVIMLLMLVALVNPVVADGPLYFHELAQCPRSKGTNSEKAAACCKWRYGDNYGLASAQSKNDFESITEFIKHNASSFTGSALLGGQWSNRTCSWFDKRVGCPIAVITTLSTGCLSIKLSQEGFQLMINNCDNTRINSFICQHYPTNAPTLAPSTSLPVLTASPSLPMPTTPYSTTTISTFVNVSLAANSSHTKPWRPAWVIACLVVLVIAGIGTIAFLTRRAFKPRGRQVRINNNDEGFASTQSVEDADAIPFNWGVRAFVKGLNGPRKQRSGGSDDDDLEESLQASLPKKNKRSYCGFTESDMGKLVYVDGYAQPGFLRFVGNHKIKGAPRCGVQFNEPIGKNNGFVSGHYYFACPPNCGVLVVPRKVKLLKSFQPPAPTSATPPVFENANAIVDSNNTNNNTSTNNNTNPNTNTNNTNTANKKTKAKTKITKANSSSKIAKSIKKKNSATTSAVNTPLNNTNTCTSTHTNTNTTNINNTNTNPNNTTTNNTNTNINSNNNSNIDTHSNTNGLCSPHANLLSAVLDSSASQPQQCGVHTSGMGGVGGGGGDSAVNVIRRQTSTEFLNILNIHHNNNNNDDNNMHINHNNNHNHNHNHNNNHHSLMHSINNSHTTSNNHTVINHNNNNTNTNNIGNHNNNNNNNNSSTINTTNHNDRRIDAWLVDGVTSEQASHSLLEFTGLSPGCYCLYTETQVPQQTQTHLPPPSKTPVLVVLMSNCKVVHLRLFKDSNGYFSVCDQTNDASRNIPYTPQHTFATIYDLVAFYAQENMSDTFPLLKQCIPVWVPDATSSV